jgi:predicted PurR-regulated permease PerM
MFSSMQGNFKISNGFSFGLLGGLGVLTALLIGNALASLASLLTYIAAALFIALGLDPILKWLGTKNVQRPAATAIVTAALLAALTAVIWGIAPTLVSQASNLISSTPSTIESISKLDFVVKVDNQFNGAVSNALENSAAYLSDSANWPTMLGGVVQVGLNIFNGFFGGLIIVILTIYFMAALPGFKKWVYSFVASSGRAQFTNIADQVSDSVGRYVIGQVSIGFIGSSLGFIFMTIMNIPFVVVLTFISFLLGLIPLVGSITAAVIVTAVALTVSPTVALVSAIYYLIYMQVEAYLISPRIMKRAVSVPGSVVVIAALAGGVVLGVLGALIAIPVAASVILITRQVIFPRQDAA